MHIQHVSETGLAAISHRGQTDVSSHRLALRCLNLAQKQSAMELQFLIPHFEETSKLSHKVVFDSLVHHHSTFRHAAEPWSGKSLSINEKHACGELKVIRQMFPDVSSERDLLTATAWLFVLCALDDLIEEADTDSVRYALTRGIEILTGDLSQALDLDLNHASSLSNKTSFLLQSFFNHVVELLPSLQASVFLDAAVDVLIGLVAETDFRASGQMSTYDYMRIRERTIGIAPFFKLLYTEKTGQVMGAGLVQELSGLVSKIAGLQNDLVGFEKDFQENEHMNAVIVATCDDLKLNPSDVTAQHTQRYVLKAVTNHNDAVVKAKSTWQSIYNHTCCPYEREVSDIILGFARTHFLWTATSKRYQLA